jgi:hypothetical protein
MMRLYRPHFEPVKLRGLRMPGGKFDSSKTRVTPVFKKISERGDGWVYSLLKLVNAEAAATATELDLSSSKAYFGEHEHALDPPVSLLSWLVRNPTPAVLSQKEIAERTGLAQRDSVTVQEALRLLRASATSSGWYILEGQTYPDVFIETPDALVVVEGKRTEAGPTTHTKFMEGRHQIWRHIDAAWEIRGRRRVFGFFAVEGIESTGDIPENWREAVNYARSTSALETSFPHRSIEERSAIARCLLGVTTWQLICREFGIPFSDLPKTVDELATPGEGETSSI